MIGKLRFAPLSPYKMCAAVFFICVRFFEIIAGLIDKFFHLFSVPPTAGFNCLSHTWIVVTKANIKFEVIRVHFRLHVIVLGINYFVQASY